MSARSHPPVSFHFPVQRGPGGADRLGVMSWAGLLTLASRPVLLVLAIGIAGTPHPGLAQDNWSDSLKASSLPELLDAVRTNNPSLHAARYRAAALGERSEQVTALPDPTVMLTYQPFPILTARGTQRTQLRLEQTIPYPGKRPLRGSVAALTSEMALYDAATMEQDLLLAVKQAYYDLHRASRQQALIRRFQQQIAEFEAIATTQYTVGSGMQQPILRAQLERNTLDNQFLMLTRTRQTQLESLSRLTNRPVDDSGADSAGAWMPRPPSLSSEDLLGIALGTRPEAAALGAAADRADTETSLARKDFYPDLGINLTYFDIAAADMPPTATGRDALALGVAVRIPLQRGRLRARLEETRLERQHVAARQEALETSFRTEIRDYVQQMVSDLSQLDLYRDALIPQATTTLEATLSAYTTGRIDFLNLLDAERMLFNLQWGYEELNARYLKTTAALERALGVESLSDLQK